MKGSRFHRLLLFAAMLPFAVLPVAAIPLLVLAGCLFVSGPLAAEESKIPADGLIAWYAAEDLQAEGVVDRWPDRSPAQRHLEQPLDVLRPQRIDVEGSAVVRFDGQDDHLRSFAGPTEIAAATLFLVAAAHENPGDFSGFIAAGARQGRDYETGFNIDQGPLGSLRFQSVNIEGIGFGGAVDLLDRSSPFGTLQILQATIDPDSRQVTARLANQVTGSRPLEPRPMQIEHLTLGARFYTNGPGPQQVRGPFHGDLVEVIVYNRVLSPAEADSVYKYLHAKHAALSEALPRTLNLPSENEPIIKAANPPLLQMLVPGFEVREIPLELTNVNNVRFRDDGTLVTLGYNGDIHLLTDSDGDGIEDRAALFWKNDGQLRSPLGMVWTPPGSPHGQGAFIPNKGKVSLIVDTDGDDRADHEQVVASGWPEIPHNIDALGIAMDKDGAIYFGIGTTDFTNPYLIDAAGKGHYDLANPRGTIQRISPDFSHRETVCTGIRFPVALAFNSRGDLFCTDQEGATWLPNGNPFDELLHLQPGRHYGFPPRHSIHNPTVIDEPSTYDYAPQHQSTCGLVFNPLEGPHFGPSHWRGDAFVCGESRGKLWRTTLIRSPHGYLATSQLIAALQMLTVDACVAPNGDLVVACHSGPPDWGTGPAGMGKLFRIRTSTEVVPRPSYAWAVSPQELRIAFDAPLEPEELADLRTRIELVHGPAVRAGDCFENLAPPYAIVQRQLLGPRSSLALHSLAVTSDLRTLILTTDPVRDADHHVAIRLPVRGETQLDFPLCGVGASWEVGAQKQRTVLPHLDLEVARKLTAQSGEHVLFWNEMQQAGTLTLETQLDLAAFLRPRVQPGSQVDDTLPPESVTIHISSGSPVVIEAAGAVVDGQASTGADSLPFTGRLTVDSTSELIPLRVRIQGDGTSPLRLQIAVSTSEDPRLRPLSLQRMFLPWTARRLEGAATAEAPAVIPALEGGSWGRGRKVFHSQAAGCFKCHGMQGIGAKIGPDLAHLIHRDYDSVLRDILHPSYAINPDYIHHAIELEDGRILTGVIRSDGEGLIVGDAQGLSTRIVAAEIERLQPLTTSAMPTGLLDSLSAQERRDLLTYLLTAPPQMPLESPLRAPPPRSIAEVQQVLSGAPPLPAPLMPLQLVLVAGPKDHGPNEHDYPAWQQRWAQLLAAGENVDVSLAWEFPSDEQLQQADGLIFFQKGAWDDPRAQRLDAFLQRGGGAVYIHWAVNGDDRAEEFANRIGLASRGGWIKYRHGELKLDLHSTDHPILRNLEPMKLYDESYWMLTGAVENVTLLASSVEEGQSRPQVWVYERGKGRVFCSIPGHYSWTFDDPLFRILLLRGIAWTMDQPVDRFNDLVTPGARLQR